MPEDNVAARLAARLAAFTSDVSASARLVPAGAVRIRGDRRKTQLAAATAVAAGVLTATAGVVLSTASGGGPSGAASGGLATVIPDELEMPHEGDSGWQRDDSPKIASVVQPCGTDVTLPQRTDARTLTGRGHPVEEEHSPTAITNQLFLYESEAAAAAVMTHLNTELTRCAWLGGSADGTAYGQHVIMARDQISGPPMQDFMAIRRGNAVYLSHSLIGGALMSSADYPAVEEMGRRLCAVLDLCEPEMCYYPAPSPSAPVGVPCVSGSPLQPIPSFPQVCYQVQPSPSAPVETTCPPPDASSYPSTDPSYDSLPTAPYPSP